MLQSVDTYLQKEVKCKLEAILNNRYIIKEILKDIQCNVADNFIEYYVDGKNEIPIIYTMPQTKELQRASIYIGLREGKETNNSVGNLEGKYDYKGENIEEEVVEMKESEDGEDIVIEVKYPIGNLINVENVSFSKDDNVRIEDNKVFFRYDPYFVGKKFGVKYERTEGNEEGVRKGFTTTESYSVLAVSTNMDTVRCLDLIIKAILILMRENKEEKNSILLQRLQFGQIEEIELDSSTTPEILYGRENIVTYTISYSLDFAFLTKIDRIILDRTEQW